MMQVRESFKQTASNLAKLLKKQWPMLSCLIFEKPRNRTGSGMSSVDGSPSLGSSIGDLAGGSHTAVRLELKARTMSVQEDSPQTMNDL
jgi:hypothetical protein